MVQSSEDSSTIVHGYQSISQLAPLPVASWLPNTAHACPVPDSPSTQPGHCCSPCLAPGLAALPSSCLFLPPDPPRLGTPDLILRPKPHSPSPTPPHPASGITGGVQLGLAGWHVIPHCGQTSSLTHSTLTASLTPTPLHSCRPPGCERGWQGQHPKHRTAHAPQSPLQAPLCTSASTPKPTAQPCAPTYCLDSNLPTQLATASRPSHNSPGPVLAASPVLGRMLHTGMQPCLCPALRAQASHPSTACGPRAPGPSQPLLWATPQHLTLPLSRHNTA